MPSTTPPTSAASGQPLQAAEDDDRHRAGDEPVVDRHGVPITVATTPFQVFRLRLGRRSAAQVRSLPWSDDPSEVFAHLFQFGPSPVDIDE